MSKILVTGGMGFVGRHIVRACVRQDHEVTAVDDLSTGVRPILWPHDLYLTSDEPTHHSFMDVREWFKLNRNRPFDTIFHCAAVVGGRLKIEGDPLAVATDLAIDAEFFNWCARLDPKPKRIVYFSSSAVYPVELQTRTLNVALGEGMTQPGRQARIAMPDMTYGWAKLSGEYLAWHAVERYGLNVHIFRPFSGYGEDQSTDYPFPALIRRVLDKQDPVTVWGSGEQQRDWIHIDDVVDAVMRTAAQKPGFTLNLGTGIGTSFLDLARRMLRILDPGSTRAIVADINRPEGVFARVADTYYLENLGLKPRISLDDGIRQVAAYLDKEKIPA